MIVGREREGGRERGRERGERRRERETSDTENSPTSKYKYVCLSDRTEGEREREWGGKEKERGREIGERKDRDERERGGREGEREGERERGVTENSPTSKYRYVCLSDRREGERERGEGNREGGERIWGEKGERREREGGEKERERGVTENSPTSKYKYVCLSDRCLFRSFLCLPGILTHHRQDCFCHGTQLPIVRPICNLRFADDIDLMGGSNGERQDFTNRLVDRATAYGVEVSTDKKQDHDQQHEQH